MYTSFCRRSCSVSDKSDKCWSQSLEYFTEDLARALDDYTGTLIYIARWRSKLKKEGEKFKHFEEEHLNKTIKELFKPGNERILPEDALYDVLNLALAKVKCCLFCVFEHVMYESCTKWTGILVKSFTVILS